MYLRLKVVLKKEMRRRQCRVPTQNNIVGTQHCRLLYHTDATGNDMTFVSINPDRLAVKRYYGCSRS